MCGRGTPAPRLAAPLDLLERAEAKARRLHQDAVKAMDDCAERVAVELPGLLEITVRDISPM